MSELQIVQTVGNNPGHYFVQILYLLSDYYNLMPMAHDYSLKQTDPKSKAMTRPNQATLNFIRQFARTYVVLQGMGTVVIN